MKVQVLLLGKPTQNNRIYPPEVVQKAMAQKPELPIFRHAGEDYTIGIAVGKGVLHMDQDALYAECSISDADLVKQIEDGKLYIRPAGTGSVVKGVVADDYQLEFFFLTSNPA